MHVVIISQPVKAAAKGKAIYLEVHNYEDGRDLYKEALEILSAKNLLQNVDLNKVNKACREPNGLLMDVAK